MSCDVKHTWRFWIEGEYEDKDIWNPDFATEYVFPQWQRTTMTDNFYAKRAVEKFLYARLKEEDPLDGFTQLIIFAEDEVGRRFCAFVSQRIVVEYDADVQNVFDVEEKK